MTLLMDNYLIEQFGDKLKELRKKKGWAQEDVAREIGVSLSTVQRWEKQGGRGALGWSGSPIGAAGGSRRGPARRGGCAVPGAVG